MKKYIFWADFGMPIINMATTILTVFVLVMYVFCCSSCTTEEFEDKVLSPDSTTQKVAEKVIEMAPAARAITISLPYTVWGIFVIDIVSAVAAVVVAARKKNLVKES